MQQGTADIDVATGTIQEQGDRPIHRYPGSCDPHHQAGAYMLRVLQTPKSFVEDKKRDHHERTGIHQCGEDSGALIAVRFTGVRRARLKVHGDEGE